MSTATLGDSTGAPSPEDGNNRTAAPGELQTRPDTADPDDPAETTGNSNGNTATATAEAPPRGNRRWALGIFGGLATAVVAGAVAAKGGAIAGALNRLTAPDTPQPQGGGAPEVTRTPMDPESYPWKQYPGETGGSTGEAVMTSWVNEVEWAMNNPNRHTDPNDPSSPTGTQVLERLFDQHTRSGVSWYGGFSRWTRELQARYRAEDTTHYPSDVAYDLTMTIQGPVRIPPDDTGRSFADVREFAIQARIDHSIQRAEGPLGVRPPESYEAGWFTFRRHPAVDAQGQPTTVWRFEQLHPDSTKAFSY